MVVVAMAALAVTPWQSLDAGARGEQLAQRATSPLEARFVAATEGFLGARYVLSPLGEGEGFDADPLLRYDAADCVTMVESSMALALASADDEVLPTLNRIRYAGAPSYEGRLHVMEAQWLPVNLRRGFIEDVTRSLGGAATRRVSKRIGEDTWREKSGASLKLAPEAQVKGVFDLDLVPADVAPSVLARAPEGLIVVVVRADRPRLVSRITHVGVLVQKDSGPHLRHASRSFGKVVDEPVERYLRRNLEFGAWTVEGVSLYRVREPPRPVVEPVAVAEADAGVARPVDEPGPRDAGAPTLTARAAQPPKGCGCSASATSAVLGLVVLSRRRRATRPSVGCG
ncbi:MAG: DUF1460 domain-containing protein [Myxococcaceae bacterium]|nr:DUF1460 domain-containing protein [Myxococcaceae bacterium]